jgi:hypothetical protein
MDDGGGGWRIREEKRRVMLEMDSSVMHTVTHSNTQTLQQTLHTDATHTHTHTTRLVVVQRCTHNAYYTHTRYTSSIDAPSEHDEVPPPALLGDDHPRKRKGGRRDVPKRDQRPHPRAQVEDVRVAQP